MRGCENLLASVGDRLLIIPLLVVVMSLASLASAQSSGKRKVIRLEAIKVEGRIQKPQAFYILPRSNLNFEGLELRQSFIRKIVRSVDKEPF